MSISSIFLDHITMNIGFTQCHKPTNWGWLKSHPYKWWLCGFPTWCCYIAIAFSPPEVFVIPLCARGLNWDALGMVRDGHKWGMVRPHLGGDSIGDHGPRTMDLGPKKCDTQLSSGAGKKTVLGPGFGRWFWAYSKWEIPHDWGIYREYVTFLRGVL